MIQRNREFAHANSCGMPNGIRDLTRCTGDADLAHAFDAERVDVRIAFLDLLTLVETGSRFPSAILLVFLGVDGTRGRVGKDLVSLGKRRG